MKRLLFLLALFPLLSAMPYAPASSPIPSYPRALAGRTVDSLTIYEVGHLVTGAPEAVLSGLHFAESSRGTNLFHPDPRDVGEFGLHEPFHAERARLHGEYDASDPAQAAIEAGRIYQDNLKALGSEDLAICGYKQGQTGVRRDGMDLRYLERVRGAE